MKKVAIFTEGQGELIFMRRLLPDIWGYENVSFECLELYSDRLQDVPYQYTPPNPKIHLQMINVGNDERVLDIILERKNGLAAKGFEIIGLRDMYSSAYKRRAHQINPQVTKTFLDFTQKTISENSNPGEVSFFYAIMELEAWILGLRSLFHKLDPRLTFDFINEQLGYDLATIDPETEFFHPAANLDEILALVGKRYTKSKDQMEGLLKLVEPEDFLQLAESGKCNSFKVLFEKMGRLEKFLLS